jgi:hypothetical protein
MENRFGARLLFVVLAAAVAAYVGFAAYNAGVMHGLAESARLAAPAANATPGGAPPAYFYPYPYPYLWHRPWGFGFGFFPFFFIILCFFLLRRALWGGPRWGWGHHYRDGVPPRFEEWHRRAHERDTQPQPAAGAPADR